MESKTPFWNRWSTMMLFGLFVTLVCVGVFGYGMSRFLDSIQYTKSVKACVSDEHVAELLRKQNGIRLILIQQLDEKTKP